MDSSSETLVPSSGAAHARPADLWRTRLHDALVLLPAAVSTLALTILTSISQDSGMVWTDGQRVDTSGVEVTIALMALCCAAALTLAWAVRRRPRPAVNAAAIVLISWVIALFVPTAQALGVILN